MDGLSVDISISFQYRLKENVSDVVKIFNKYGNQNFTEAIEHFTKDTINDIFAEFNANQLFPERGGKFYV